MSATGEEDGEEELQPVTKRFFEEYDVEIFYADKGTSGTLEVLERVCKVISTCMVLVQSYESSSIELFR